MSREQFMFIICYFSKFSLYGSDNKCAYKYIPVVNAEKNVDSNLLLLFHT